MDVDRLELLRQLASLQQDHRSLTRAGMIEAEQLVPYIKLVREDIAALDAAPKKKPKKGGKPRP